MRAHDAEFSQKVKQILAARAGYRCSFPDCGRPTVGPGMASREIISTGVAAHIYSASDCGPRGAGELSEVERSAPENGIWLCSDHGRIVDANRGSEYPALLLRNFKSLHEARVSADQCSRPFFWIEELTVHRSPLFCSETRMRLGKVTTLVGPNGSGKTEMLRCLAALSRSSRPWVTPPMPNDTPFVYTTVVRDPAKRSIRTERLSDHLTFEVDGCSTAFNPIPVEIAFLDDFPGSLTLERFLDHRRQELDDISGETSDDLNSLAEYLAVDPRVLRNLIPRVGTFVEHSVSGVRIAVEGGRYKVLLNDKRWRPDASIHRVSGGMLGMLTVDIQIAMAEITAKRMPTALFLRLPKLQLAPDVLERYVTYLSSPSIRFQTVLETPNEQLCHPLRKCGSEIAIFTLGSGGKSSVQQD